MVFRLIGMPVVRRVGGCTAEPPPRNGARPSVARPALGGRAARRRPGPTATASDAEPLFGPSALLSVLTAADGYLIVPEDATGLSAGEEVDVFLYD